MFGSGNRGQWRQIGGEGEWANTRAVVGLNGKIYASHSNGKLFEIDPNSGQWRQVGASQSWNTRLLFALGNAVCCLEQSGTMWAVEPNSGQHAQIGGDGEWANVTAGDWTRENIYCYSKLGSLWNWGPQTGWQQIGNNTSWKSKFVFAGRGLVTVEQDNSLFRVDPDSGNFQSLGKMSHNVLAGVGMHGHVYAGFDDGKIWDLDIETGQWSTVGNASTWQPQALLTTGNNNLITLERRGTFFEVYL